MFRVMCGGCQTCVLASIPDTPFLKIAICICICVYIYGIYRGMEKNMDTTAFFIGLPSIRIYGP